MKKLKKKESDIKILACAWYWPEQWKQLIMVSEDREDLENTYEEWHEQAEKTCIELIKNGCAPYKIDVDISKLVEWCKKEGIPINGEARAFYAAQQFKLLYEKYRK